MKSYTYRIHLTPEPEGGYTVTVPALPGCVTWGQDIGEAQAMAREAILCHVEALAKVGEPIPEEHLSAGIDAVVQISLSAAA